MRKTLDLFTLVRLLSPHTRFFLAYYALLLPPGLDFDLKSYNSSTVLRQPQKKEG